MGVNQRGVGQLGGCESRVIVEVIVKMQKNGGGGGQWVGWMCNKLLYKCKINSQGGSGRQGGGG